jgi:hypothetical protein
VQKGSKFTPEQKLHQRERMLIYWAKKQGREPRKLEGIHVEVEHSKLTDQSEAKRLTKERKRLIQEALDVLGV